MNIEELKSKVRDQRSVVQSAIELIKGLHQKLDDALKSGNTAELQAIADDLKANSDSLASAVAENTPSAPTDTGTPATPGTPDSAPQQPEEKPPQT